MKGRYRYLFTLGTVPYRYWLACTVDEQKGGLIYIKFDRMEKVWET